MLTFFEELSLVGQRSKVLCCGAHEPLHSALRELQGAWQMPDHHLQDHLSQWKPLRTDGKEMHFRVGVARISGADFQLHTRHNLLNLLFVPGEEKTQVELPWKL